jgi:hypothetical protein
VPLSRVRVLLKSMSSADYDDEFLPVHRAVPAGA